MNPKSFFGELKRRNVYKIAVAYAVVGWLVVQVATQVFPFFEIPNWGVRLVVLATIVGFPIALVIAWAFEATPEGIKRTEDVDLNAAGGQILRSKKYHFKASVKALRILEAIESTPTAALVPQADKIAKLDATARRTFFVLV